MLTGLMRRWLIPIAAACMLAACKSGAPPAPPPAYLMDDAGQWQAMGQGSYCWSNPNQAVCADAIWPPPQMAAVSVGGGQPLRFQFDRTPDALDVTLYDASNSSGNPVLFTSLTPADREVSWLPELAAGSYLVNVFGRWGSDDASYFAWITITQAQSEGPIPFQPQSETVRPVYLLVDDQRVPGEAAALVTADGTMVFVPPTNDPVIVNIDAGLTAITDAPHPGRVVFLIETNDGSETVLLSESVPVEDGLARWLPDIADGDYVLVLTAEWPDAVSVVALNISLR